MSIVNSEYRRLFAKRRFLSDKVVLTHAWKKAHRFIRWRNWYADLLELDQSAVAIETKLEEWIAQIEHNEATPNSMRMVPAPKTHRWGFDRRGWHEVELEEAGSGRRPKKPIWLRPLAHLGIREQTMATAALLCLADCIETAQGDTEASDYFEARRRRIHSYGNRLFCQYDADTTGNPDRPRPLANFRWGNSETYRKYFVDYRHFLERPRVVASNVQDQLGCDEELFIVKLDLSAFFDCIHRETLIQRLQGEYRRFVSDYKLSDGDSDEGFWEALRQITDWKWAERDEELGKLLKPGPGGSHYLPVGLPQGLVASGFFSNAYLLDFDRCLSGLLKRSLAHEDIQDALPRIDSASGWNEHSDMDNGSPDLPGVMVHDYCRYVDDLRLVVSVSGVGKGGERLRDGITDWVNYWLNRAANPASESHRLQVNKDKTEVIAFRLMNGQSGVTSRMALIQRAASGPMDMEALEQATAGLDSLLTLTESFDCSNQPTDGEPHHPLAQIASRPSEVRDDTIKRFTAGRLVRMLRQRRSMTDLEAETEPGLTRGEAIDHEMEMFARKLIRAWSYDPSLVLVLRYAMDLFPSPVLLQPVLAALRGLVASRDRKQARVGWYVCADLMKAAATETGMRARDLEVPTAADLAGYRVHLLDLAKEVVSRGSLGKKSPWYAKQQALLLLAVVKPHAPYAAGRRSAPELQRYFDLLRLAGYPPQKSLDRDELVAALVHQQLHPSPESFAEWLIAVLAQLDGNQRAEHLTTLAFTRPDLMAVLLEKMDQQRLDWIDNDHRYLRICRGMLHDQRDLGDFDNERVALWNLVTRPDNPFRQEILWLKLAYELIKRLQGSSRDGLDPKGLSLRAVTIRAGNWHKLRWPELEAGQLEVVIERDSVLDSRLEIPGWCVYDKRWFYALGRLLRCAVTGEQDFTVTPYLSRHDWDGYAGMRNSWFTRSIGMIHAPEQLGGDAAPFSPWVSELLMRLLQWPGMGMTETLIARWDSVETLDDLSALVRDRLVSLSRIYGRASDLPVYPIPVGRPTVEPGKLRVALVQTLRPRLDDFCKADPCLNNATFRARHRRHLSAVCDLLIKQLEAQRSAEEKTTGREGRAYADLIVLPELSVHPDDVWILERLSDKTKAMLYFGLTPAERASVGLVNTARWMIPNQSATGRRGWIVRDQGKHHPTGDEEKLGIKSWRPYQVIIELPVEPSAPRGFRIAGTICYDATDLRLAADLRDVSDLLVITALNRDITTFDNMVGALHYHMFQHLVLVNTGEFGGSTVQAPFRETYQRTITHHHGGGQIGISIFDLRLTDFGPTSSAAESSHARKTRPAGFRRFD